MAKKPSLLPLLTVNFIGTLGFSIVLPFLVILVTKFGGDAIMFGILGAVYPAFQLLGAPYLGRWSDRYGRRKILLLSHGGTLIAWVIFFTALLLPVTPLFELETAFAGMLVFTLPLLVLFFARALDGVTGGNVSVANAYLADVTEEKDRSKNYGKMSISANLGFIIGPALAGLLGATLFEELLPVAAAILISLVGLFVIFFKLEESNPCTLEKEPHHTSVPKALGQEHKGCYSVQKKMKFSDILKIQHIPYLLILYFLIYLGFNIFYTAFPIHAIQSLGWSITDMGIYFSFLSLVMIIVQGPILGKVSGFCRESILIVSGSIILAINFVLLSFPQTTIIYTAAALFAIGNGLMWPSMLSVISKHAGKTQGAVQGLTGSFGSFASIIGLITGGILYNFFGAFAFLVTAGILGLVFLLSIRLLSFNESHL